MCGAGMCIASENACSRWVLHFAFIIPCSMPSFCYNETECPHNLLTTSSNKLLMQWPNLVANRDENEKLMWSQVVQFGSFSVSKLTVMSQEKQVTRFGIRFLAPDT